MSEILEKDRQAREKIKNETDRNFFVEAGAGSGKTYSLVQRMTSMVEKGADITKICAITFTKAAAGEFYERFHRSLIERSRSDEIQPEVRERLQYAAENIDLCFMGTIDSFCNMIISEHPVLAGVPSDSVIRSEKEMDDIYRRKLTDIARGNYGDELREKYVNFRKFNGYQSEKAFLNLVKTVSGIRNGETVVPVTETTSLEEAFENDKGDIIRLFDEIDENRCFYNDSAGEIFEELKNREYILKGDWDKRPYQVIEFLKDFGSKVETDENGEEKVENKIRLSENCRYIKDFPGFYLYHEKSKNWYNIIMGPDNRLVEKAKEIKYSVTMDFIVSAVNAFSEEICSNGDLTYFDYLYYLRNMLKASAESDGRLIKHIYDRHSYFLVDEFQDTNPMQAEILFYLTAENPDPDWRKCTPKPGSLFIVGDPKQSIYRFRNADVTSYIGVKKLFTGKTGEVLSLTRNWRSTEKMCSWFNKKFNDLLPQEDTEIQAKFEGIPTDENPEFPGCFGGVYQYRLPVKDSIVPDIGFVKGLISNLYDNGRYLICDKEGGKPRKIRYSDFMIITPAKTNIDAFIKGLRDAGIPVKAEGSVPFDKCDVLRDISVLFSAVAAPHDSKAVYGALTDEVFALQDSEISDFIQKGGKLDLFAGNNVENCPAVSGAMEKLKSFALRAEELSPASMLSAIQQDLEIFRKSGADYLEYYYYALELLRNAGSSGEVVSFREAADYLSDIIEGNTENERCISLSESENRVLIANVHKVKGLEAQIVILASPYSKKKSPSVRTTEVNGEKKNLILKESVRDKKAENTNIYAETNLFPEEQDAEQACLEAEKIRMLYVAATRAKSALIIGNNFNTDKKKKSGFGPCAENSFWKELVDDSIPLADDFAATATEKKSHGKNAGSLYRASEETTISASYSKAASYTITLPSKLKLKSKISDEEDTEDEEETAAGPEERQVNAARQGTAIHRLMEMLVSSGNTIDGADAIEEIISEYGLTDPGYREVLTGVYKAVTSGGYAQSNDMPSDILAELLSADEVYCEVPFCCSNEKDDGTTEILHGVMDVVYLKEGAWHIVDYKTNYEGDGLGEKYENQLSAYSSAFKALTGNDADAHVWHINTKK